MNQEYLPLRDEINHSQPSKITSEFSYNKLVLLLITSGLCRIQHSSGMRCIETRYCETLQWVSVNVTTIVAGTTCVKRIFFRNVLYVFLSELTGERMSPVSAQEAC
jgi:hypothetical protein